MTASNIISNSPKSPRGARTRNGASSSSTIDRFELSGRSLALDPRIHAYREDIADVALAGQLFAPHYARPMIRSCGLIVAPVRSAPSDSAPVVSELLPGEDFAVVDISGPWAWGYCRADHYVGYVETIALVELEQATHVVVEAKAPIEAGTDPTSPILASLPMGSRVRGTESGAILAMESGFLPLSHLRRIGDYEKDPVSVAQRLLGAPYAAGGRTAEGIDSSGLVQLALGLCGIPAQRDVDQQRSLGEKLAEGTKLQRGDLVFFGQNVGLVVDDSTMIQVDPGSGKVVLAPLSPGSDDGIECRRIRR